MEGQVDAPFRPGAEVSAGIADYGFKDDELAAIGNGNARRLMPQLKA